MKKQERYAEYFKKFKYFAGHSLGEYCALYFAESLKFEEMLEVVKCRGDSMSIVSDPDKYLMYAILKKEDLEFSFAQEMFFDDRYQAIAILGEGGFGRVYKVRITQDGEGKTTHFTSSLQFDPS